MPNCAGSANAVVAGANVKAPPGAIHPAIGVGQALETKMRDVGRQRARRHGQRDLPVADEELSTLGTDDHAQRWRVADGSSLQATADSTITPSASQRFMRRVYRRTSRSQSVHA
jgi:hypothetical protein